MSQIYPGEDTRPQYKGKCASNEAQEETDIPVQLSDLVADMVAESLRHIPEGYDGNHPCVQNAGSRIDVFGIRVSASGNGHGSGIQSVA